MDKASFPVAIIGAGPVGLAAAAHLVERNEKFILLEAASRIAENIEQWQHVQMFSPWRYNVDRTATKLLKNAGWNSPDLDVLPTGGELIDMYLQPLAELPEIQANLRLNHRVTAISRRNKDKMKDSGRSDTPFVIRTESADGEENIFYARAVIDATGTWSNPNPMGADGLYVPGERRFADCIFYGIPDVTGVHRSRYINKTVAVVGSGHSAINALLELAQLQKEAPQTEIVWILRKGSPEATYGGEEDDALPARGRLGMRIRELVESGVLRIHAPFFIRGLEPTDDGIVIFGDTPHNSESVAVSAIIVATGARPDLSMLRELRLSVDHSVESTEKLAPLIDPNIHSCGTVPPHGENELRHPEKDFYIVGMKSYGRAPTFLLATGYEQVRSVVAGLVGDREAAEDVQLELPETGVCSTNLIVNGSSVESCCEPGPHLIQQVDIPIAIGGEPVAMTATTTRLDCCEPGSGCC